MKKIGYILIFLCGIGFSSLQAQSFGMSRFFRTGMRLTSYYLPEMNLNDSTTFGIHTMNCAFVIPVGGNLNLNLRELNVKFQQTFLTTNFGMRFIQTNLIDNQQLYNAALGITHVRASLKNGFWFYSANLGMIEDKNYLHKVHPYFLGAFAKIKVQGLRKHTIFGVALTYNSGVFLPVPILGINRKLAKKWDINVLLPVEIALIYHPSKRLDINTKLYFSTFDARTGNFMPRFNLSDQIATMTYREIRAGVRADYKISGKYRLFLEAGTVGFRNLQFAQNQELSIEYTPNFSPYAQLSFHLDFGKSPIGSQLFGNEF